MSNERKSERSIVTIFKFLTLFSFVVACIAHISMAISYFTGNLSNEAYVISLLFVFAIMLNWLIAKGLNYVNLWAYIVGGIELIALLVVGILRVLEFEFLSFISGGIVILVFSIFLRKLFQDYQETQVVR